MNVGSRLWRAKQYKTVGGNAMGAILGVHPFLSATTVYERMREVFLTGKATWPKAEGPDLNRGIHTEPIHRRMLAKVMGETLVAWPQGEFLVKGRCHILPDAQVKSSGTPVELKCPRPFNCRKFRLGGLPEYYLVQAQLAMEVMGQSNIILSVFDVEQWDLEKYDLERDSEFGDVMMDKAGEFYRKVELGEPPEEPEGAIVPIPEHTGSLAIMTTPDAVEAANSLLTAKAMLSEIGEMNKLCEDRIKVLMGSADAVEIPDVMRMYHKFSKPGRTFDHKKAVADDPGLARYYKPKKAARPFNSYDLRPLDRRLE